MREKYGLSERHACRLVSQPRGAEGFMRAVALRADGWEPLMRSKRHGILLLPILARLEQLKRLPTDLIIVFVEFFGTRAAFGLEL